MSNNFSVNLNAYQIFNYLDAKDGNVDKRISAEKWNEFAELAGGKTVKYGIEETNALKSINYYLTKLSNESKKTITEYLGAEIGNNSSGKTTTVQNREQKQSQNTQQKTPQKIDIENKTAAEIFEELDLMDGQKDNKIIAVHWNNFATQVGGKSINLEIGRERGLKSINYYLSKISKSEQTTSASNKTNVAKTTTPAKTTIDNSTARLRQIGNSSFEQDTIDLNNQRFEHSTRLLEIAQDSLGIYEITAAEYEYLKRVNPDELKNTQAAIVGEYGMKNNHQWCAYTVGYFVQEAGMDMPKLSTVQAYIDKYKNDYNTITLNKMNFQNYQTERLSRAKQIKAQLPNMHEGDFIIWKGDYVVNTGNGQTSSNKASHIGFIEHVDVEKGIVIVIEGNANVSEMDDNNERIPVKTAADGKRGAQVVGEYKDLNNRDGLIRKQYTIEELAKHGYTGFIDNSSRVK